MEGELVRAPVSGPWTATPEDGHRLLITSAEAAAPASWWANLAVWQPLRDTAPAAEGAFDAVVIDWLSEDRWQDPAVRRTLLEAACIAVRDQLGLLVVTPMPRARLWSTSVGQHVEGLGALDVDRLLAGEEFLYLLQTRCGWLDETEGTEPTPTGTGAAVYLTPIERRLAEAMRRAEVPFEVQVPLGRFRADFVVDGRIVVEADGAAYHDAETDAARDRELAAAEWPTVRFSGRQIISDVESCLERIQQVRRSTPSATELELPGPAPTAAQARVVAHLTGPSLVVAPAGAGKTNTVVARIARLVDSGVDPQRICAVSFTNAAVKELRDRLAGIADDGTYKTVHSLAVAILKDKGLYNGQIVDANPRSPRTPSRWEIGRRVVPQEGQKTQLRDWLDAISTYRSSLAVPEIDHLHGLEAGDPNKRFLEVCRRWQAELDRRGCTDFAGQILSAIDLLARDWQHRTAWSARFDQIIVDEYQDLLGPQLSLMRMLASPLRNLQVVGDDDQIIYGFAGSSFANFASLERIWPDTIALPLDRNFRCSHEVVIRSGWLIRRNQQRVTKDIIAARAPEADRVRIVTAAEQLAAYDRTGLEWVQERLSAGDAYDDIALLFRTRAAAAPVELALATARIPHNSIARSSLLRSTVGKTVHAWMAVAARKADRDQVVTTLYNPPRYLARVTVDHVAPLGRGLAEIEDVIEAAVKDPTGLPCSAQQSQGMASDALAEWLKAVGAARALSDQPTTVLRALGLGDWAAKLEAEASQGPAAGGQTASPTTIYKVLERVAAQCASVDDFCDWADSLDDSEDMVEADGPDEPHVRLSTIHGAKGRQWPSVAVLGPRGAMPDGRADADTEKEEERRVAYVAVTRAKEHLLVCCSEQYGSELMAALNGLTYEQHLAGLTEPPRPQPAATTATRVPPPPPTTDTVVTEREPETLLQALRQLWRRFIG
jgi:DNA helicase II / ATP-dependent DNA helicase PcrA